MDKIDYDIEQFSSLLKRKDFAGQFGLAAIELNQRLFGDIRYVLKTYLHHLDGRNQEIGNCLLTSRVKDEQGEGIEFGFELNYSRNGIAIERLHITHNSGYSQQLPISHNMQLPHRDQLLYPRAPRQIRVRNDRGRGRHY